MADAAAVPASFPIKYPEQIVIDQSHVCYACAVLWKRLKSAPNPREPVIKFEDSRCPSMYIVYIIWDIPRGQDAEPRAVGFGQSQGLARAIKIAAEQVDPEAAAITWEEGKDLRCTVILLHQFRRVVEPSSWQAANHGLVLRKENPEYNPQQEGSLRYVTSIYLGEVAKCQGWSFNRTLSFLLEDEGSPDDLASCLRAVLEGRVYYFGSSNAAFPYQEALFVHAGWL
jgi:hypothetical protein